ncbi:DUF4190 domain-containing protein [Streptomyces sp. NPDC056485]|uniref:DUF4190 domain-containing protein n=1 Tax=Streptomyces sp. NPDC056485 TaxID=3345834 RepID=UPI0036953753
MSTPPNQPSTTPSGTPTEPAGTPIPEPAAEPAQPLSLQKTPQPEAAPAPAPEPQPATAPEPGPTPEPTPAPAPAPAHAPAPAPAPEPQPARVDPFAPPAPGAFAPPAAGSFAPPAPMPPAPSFGAPVPPVPPAGGPWGAHAPGATPGNPWGTPAPSTTNGLAVAALTLGIAAVVIGIIPFLFWAGGILALVGIGIGIGALVRASKGAGRKAMAVTGTALAVLGIGASAGGLFLTGYVVTNVADKKLREGWEVPADLDDSTSPYPYPAPSPTPTQVPGIDSPLAFGETYSYPNGIKVTLSKPKKYVTKNKYSTVGNAVEFTLTITNNSTETHNVIYAVPNVRDDKGMTAKLAFDGGDVPKMIRGDILPGESASGVLAYEVPEGTEHLVADISPGIRLPSAKFSGSIG